MKRKLKRVGLFLPTLNAYYMALYYSIKNSFNSCGVEVDGWPGLLEEREMEAFCRGFKPDVILEINRTRKQIPWLRSDIRHIAWMFDLGEWKYDELGDSDIIYFFGANWKSGFKRSKSCSMFTDWLPPAMDPDFYNRSINTKVSDFLFLGHIPSPWSSEESFRVIAENNCRKLSFGELSLKCQQEWKGRELKSFDNQSYLESAFEIASTMIGHDQFSFSDKKIRYDLSCRTVRQMNRGALIDLVLKHYVSLRIFGTDTWKEYEDYKPYFHRYISSPLEISQLFQTSRINLHEGVGLHDRVFSILGSGGFLFHKKTPDDNDYGGINTFFEPYQHFIPFDEDDFYYLSSRYLNNERSRNLMSEKACALVHNSHRWYDRVTKIIGDFENV